jgi:hypothetical protein
LNEATLPRLIFSGAFSCAGARIEGMESKPSEPLGPDDSPSIALRVCLWGFGIALFSAAFVCASFADVLPIFRLLKQWGYGQNEAEGWVWAIDMFFYRLGIKAAIAGIIGAVWWAIEWGTQKS